MISNEESDITIPAIFAERWTEIELLMKENQVPDLAISIFHSHYLQVVQGETGYLYEKDLLPVDSIASLDSLSDDYLEWENNSSPKQQFSNLMEG